MFVQMKTIIVAEGHGEKIVERFAGKGLIEQQSGFIDLSVLKKKREEGMKSFLL
ncbi:Heme-degrading monooxygenase HmoA [Anoxybacillus sp. BCO1]|nr:Heme-degrading monooxygenase HmoA [Anoxybacillus sp. BCO1]